MLTASFGKLVAVVFDNDLQTSTLFTLGMFVLLAGTLLRYKFPAKKETNPVQSHAFWAKPSHSTAYMSSGAGIGQSSSSSFARNLDREDNWHPIGHLAISRTPTTQRRANLV
jgi:hypothetical protein